MKKMIMKIEEQLNVANRTVISGIAEPYKMPSLIVIDNKIQRVKGYSTCSKKPYISIEIERTDKDLIGKTIVEFDGEYDPPPPKVIENPTMEDYEKAVALLKKYGRMDLIDELNKPKELRSLKDDTNTIEDLLRSESKD